MYKTLFCKELKRQFVLDQLRDKGITQNIEGKKLHDCDYEELKFELVKSAFRDIDITADANRWY